jgi:hypothetical protein
MNTQTVIDLNRIRWDANVEELIQRLNPIYGIEALRRNVATGFLSIFEIVTEGRRIAILVTRVDTLLNGNQELVIMHAVGNFETSQNLVSILNPVFDTLARMHKVKIIRVHTQRKGMDALLEENGYNFCESVYKKELTDVQR